MQIQESVIQTKQTPMMQQWHHCKEETHGAFLLFRLGDFYEAFHDDAMHLSQLLDLTLTKRQETPMCGIPWTTCDTYIEKLVSLGYSVAIAEQTDGASSKLMERKIVRIVTPSTSLSPTTLPPQQLSLFICMNMEGSTWAASVIDVTSSLFEAFQETDERIFIQEILKRKPKEILVSSTFATSHEKLLEDLKTNIGCSISKAPHWMFDSTSSEEALKVHFRVLSLDGLGLAGKPALTHVSGAHITFLKNTLLFPVESLSSFSISERTSTLSLDRSTIDNLELFETTSTMKGAKSLYDVLNTCYTPMGARKLRSFLMFPLLSEEEIVKRQENVQSYIDWIKTNPHKRETCGSQLKGIKDLERTCLRIHSGSFSPRDIASLGASLSHITPLQESLTALQTSSSLHLCTLPSEKSLASHIQTTLQETLPLRATDGNIIQSGISKELDELRSIKKDAHSWLATYQSTLREQLGIRTLKVGYTRAFGYYIEVSRGLADKMPSTFVRRQTLTGQERFISDELRQFEEKVLTAETQIATLEAELYAHLVTEVNSHRENILAYAKAIGEVDVFFSFARNAIERNYTRPQINTGTLIDIKKGRHPVIEASTSCPRFTPNDLSMDSRGPSLVFITGPNMGGKSTYIRQAALLTIMAQMGSYIPAEAANICIVDKVFSRVGASDDLARGHSTFMVEMSETAHILRGTTDKSLILLDEIGRGTSTRDGISLAQAVAEFLLSSSNLNPKTLFATHYFELTSLEDAYPKKVANRTVAVSEGPQGIEFLHMVVEGKADRSYGIHVASLAGMPQQVVDRACELLKKLEGEPQPSLSSDRLTPHQTAERFLFPMKNEPSIQPSTKMIKCHEFLKNLDLVKLTPLECFMKLIKFKDANPL